MMEKIKGCIACWNIKYVLSGIIILSLIFMTKFMQSLILRIISTLISKIGASKITVKKGSKNNK